MKEREFWYYSKGRIADEYGNWAPWAICVIARSWRDIGNLSANVRKKRYAHSTVLYCELIGSKVGTGLYDKRPRTCEQFAMQITQLANSFGLTGIDDADVDGLHKLWLDVLRCL